jgi:hypothetical protein
VIQLRNRDLHRSLYLPIAPGWTRLVPPQAAVSVPASVLRLPGVQRALAEERLQLVTEISTASSPDARAAAALRRDTQAAIAQAERAALEQLQRRRGGPEERRAFTRWTPELDERLVQTEFADLAALALELGVGRQHLRNRRAELRQVQRLGLSRQRKRRDDEWSAAHDARLREGWAAGQSAAVIGSAVGRSGGSVLARAKRLGLPQARPRPRTRGAHEWPDAQSEQLRRMWDAGNPMAQIAAVLGRSYGAVEGRVTRMKLTPRRTAFWIRRP